jgi:nucleoside 2-deoxyribosyltransferase
MIVVGGTYSEICFEPIWENIYGSGLRAVNLILENDKFQKVDFYTCADRIEIQPYLEYTAKIYSNLTNHITEVFKSPEFHYDHPLKTPVIYPRPDVFSAHPILIEVMGDNILAYGLLEAAIKIQGDKVVYDPQSPFNPKSFSSTGSKAKQLITIVNLSEAQKLTNCTQMKDIVDFFFDKELCSALIIKMGAKGALLFESKNERPVNIPVFRTNKVWPIGSGDVFSSYFALNWFKNIDLKTSALLASKATAIYCNSKDLAISNSLNSFDYPELTIEESPKGQIYLAGPFFTFSQRLLVNDIWNKFKALGLKVFSPFHDVGHGKAQDVVDKDLRGLDESELVFAIIDGLDPGTLFEVGYAISKKIKVVAYVQNEGEESLKMLEGTNCIIESDFATAIYKTYWTLASR